MPEPSDDLMRVLREVLAPMITADEGELYLVRADQSSVALHLRGRFSGCPGNTLVARRVIEPLIAATIPRVRLELTSGYLLPEGARKIVAE